MRGRKKKDCDIDLGLAISGALMEPGQIRTATEISYFCGCSYWAIILLERRALKKMRARLIERGITEEEAKHVLQLMEKKTDCYGVAALTIKNSLPTLM